MAEAHQEDKKLELEKKNDDTRESAHADKVMSRTSGLNFQRMDLHVHTPASEDFKNKKDVTAKAIVETATEKGLKAIAITDHQTGAWIDQVKDAAKGTDLVVFPGVEILALGGKNGVHIIGLFDLETSTKDIENFLGAIGIKAAQYGKKGVMAEKSIIEVINTIYEHKGLAVLAHCNSSKGVLSDIRGEGRKAIVSNRNVNAAEVTDADFSLDKEEKGKRVIDLLDGSDTRLGETKLAVYQASDNPHILPSGEFDGHSLAEIGRRYTYFKVDDYVSIESLRQCFIDRDVRIRQKDEFEKVRNRYPQIMSIEVKGGFLDTLHADFHPGLNTVLGAKGAGKSLVVEFMRFALNQEPTESHIAEDHRHKLVNKLERFGEVTIRIMDEAGTESSFTRRYDQMESDPYTDKPPADPASIFPALFLSQNEIVRIAESEEEQINFIDKFFDFRSFQKRIRELEQELQETDTDFALSLKAIHEARAFDNNVSNAKSQISKIDAQMKSSVFERFALAQKKLQALTGQVEYQQTLAKLLKEYNDDLMQTGSPDPDELVAGDPAVKRICSVSEQAKDIIRDGLGNTSSSLKELLDDSEQELEKYRPQFDQEKKAYEEEVQKLGGDFRGLSLQREKLVLDLERLKKKSIDAHSKADRVKKIADERDKVLLSLSKTYQEYTGERKRKCSEFEKQSNGRIRAAVKESSNVNEFSSRLISLKKGSYLKEDEIDAISQRITPNDFVLNLLRYDVAEGKREQYLKIISDLVGIELERMKVLADFLLAKYEYEMLLALQYQAIPKDRPEIKVDIGEGQFGLLRDVSTGQKCTAMLIMALCDGTMPVIVDQPEDSLDMRSIWDDMCSKLRKGKEVRQFLFTTHNANLAVPSDTDKYTILEADAHHGNVVFCGAIDSDKVREEVIKYLEGGVPTYRVKYQKYNMERTLGKRR